MLPQTQQPPMPAYADLLAQSASSTPSIPIPTFPSFTLRSLFFSATIADNAAFYQTNRPMTLHHAFTKQLLFAMETDAYFTFLTEKNEPVFTAALPHASQTVIQRAGEEMKNGAVEALFAYFSITLANAPRQLRTVQVETLRTEVQNALQVSFSLWGKTWEGELALDIGELEEAVGEKVERVEEVLVEMLVWWHRQFVVEIDREVRRWRGERVNEWLEAQVRIWRGMGWERLSN